MEYAYPGSRGLLRVPDVPLTVVTSGTKDRGYESAPTKPVEVDPNDRKQLHSHCINNTGNPDREIRFDRAAEVL
jgi:hypothetical protein